MGVKAGSHTACTLGTIILFIAVTGNGRQQFIIGYFIFNRIVFDVMSLIIQRNCIGFDLCIKGTQILSGGVVYFNVILRAGWLIIVIERTACYQLVRSRSICNGSGSACSEWSCTKSLAPGVFAAVLGRCCSIACVFDRFVVLICLINFDIVTHTRSFLQLFHDDDIVIFNTVGNFDKAVVGSGIIGCSSYRFRSLGIIVGCTISILDNIAAGILIRPLLPSHSIARNIPPVMTESNRASFIGRGLIANRCSVINGDNRITASS